MNSGAEMRRLIDDGSVSDVVLGECPRMRRRALTRRSLSVSELQRLVRFFHARSPQSSRRIRAILLLAIRSDGDRSIIPVAEELDVAPRVIHRWVSWYRDAGVRGLLRSDSEHYRQCSGPCFRVMPAVEFSSRSWRCRQCDRARSARRRRDPKHRARERHYEATFGKVRRDRYRTSSLGRASAESYRARSSALIANIMTK